MASTHKRNVRGMHDARRCEDTTASDQPCGNPALKDRHKCWMHDESREKTRKSRKRGRYSREALKLDKEAAALRRQIDLLARRQKRDGYVPDLHSQMREIACKLNDLTKQDYTLEEKSPVSDQRALERRSYDIVLTYEELHPRNGDGRPVSGLPYRGYDPERPNTTVRGVRDRARGSMFGLAVGNLLGAEVERQGYGGRANLDDLLKARLEDPDADEHGSHIAVALALMDSLISTRRSFDEADFLDRIIEGLDPSSGAIPIGELGDSTAEALDRYMRTKNPIAGSLGLESADSDSMARLAPVAVRYWNEPGNLREMAMRQCRATHGAVEAVHGCIALAGVLGEAIRGVPRDRLLRRRYEPLTPSIAAVMRGSWKTIGRDEVRSSGYAPHSLEAALWCVECTDDFEYAMLCAALLGGNASANLAITGQLAGALYGERAIPERWREHLELRGSISHKTDELLDDPLYRNARKLRVA